jgi:hypothetical protein
LAAPVGLGHFGFSHEQFAGGLLSCRILRACYRGSLVWTADG